MNRKQFDKKHLLLEIEWSEAIEYYHNENKLDDWNTTLMTDFHCYTNQCHLLYNEYLFAYLGERANKPVKLVITSTLHNVSASLKKKTQTFYG